MKDSPPRKNETTRDAPMSPGEDIITPLTLDPDKYREHLDEFDLSEEQQNELLETLWNIMRTFVEIGFGLDSVQIFSSPMIEKARRDSGNTVGMKDSTQHFNKAALHNASREESHE
ncbi:MAG: hypothetical protein ABFS45_03925 [Pseudomonadota bacterium]